jgi:two-component system cell cycle response regulator DivK
VASVLVVEDNLANQRLMKMLLDSMGHEVRCALTGEEGWALLQDRKYDAILLDMHLPGIDGFELAKRIKGLMGMDLKIYAVTAMAMEGDRQKVLESGCDDYFTKPLSIPEFREKITRLLGGEEDE